MILGNVFSIAFLIIFGLKIIKREKKIIQREISKDITNSKDFKQTRNKYNKFPTGEQLQRQKQYVPNYHTSKFDNSLMEDRTHDWLSEQLACERRAQTTISDMFQLRRSHFKECNAEQARQSTQKMSQQEMNDLKEKIRNRLMMQ